MARRRTKMLRLRNSSFSASLEFQWQDLSMVDGNGWITNGIMGTRDIGNRKSEYGSIAHTRVTFNWKTGGEK